MSSTPAPRSQASRWTSMATSAPRKPSMTSVLTNTRAPLVVHHLPHRVRPALPARLPPAPAAVPAPRLPVPLVHPVPLAAARLQLPQPATAVVAAAARFRFGS